MGWKGVDRMTKHPHPQLLLQELMLIIAGHEFPFTKIRSSGESFVIGCQEPEQAKEIISRLTKLFGDDPNFPDFKCFDLRGVKPEKKSFTIV